MKTVTPEEAKQKIRRYCAYQERSHQEVRNKLYGYGLRRDDLDEIMAGLIQEGYLNEERFARAFAGGKFRMKKWGRIKIVRALESKGVSGNCIRIGLKEIDDDAYFSALRKLLQEKLETLEDESNPHALRNRLSAFAIRKGYEPELAWKEINDLVR